MNVYLGVKNRGRDFLRAFEEVLLGDLVIDASAPEVPFQCFHDATWVLADISVASSGETYVDPEILLGLGYAIASGCKILLIYDATLGRGKLPSYLESKATLLEYYPGNDLQQLLRRGVRVYRPVTVFLFDCGGKAWEIRPVDGCKDQVRVVEAEGDRFNKRLEVTGYRDNEGEWHLEECHSFQDWDEEITLFLNRHPPQFL